MLQCEEARPTHWSTQLAPFPAIGDSMMTANPDAGGRAAYGTVTASFFFVAPAVPAALPPGLPPCTSARRHVASGADSKDDDCDMITVAPNDRAPRETPEKKAMTRGGTGADAVVEDALVLARAKLGGVCEPPEVGDLNKRVGVALSWAVERTSAPRLCRGSR